MTALEKSKAGKLGLHNEYGAPLTIDAVKLALKQQGLTVSSEKEFNHKVLTEVENTVRNKEVEAWEERRRSGFRRYYLALWALAAVGTLQAMLLVVGIWAGDWRYAQTAFAMLVMDAVAGFVAGHFLSRVPDKDSRPDVRRHYCYDY